MPQQLHTKVNDLVLCCITLVWLPDVSPLLVKTCRNIQCDMAT